MDCHPERRPSAGADGRSQRICGCFSAHRIAPALPAVNHPAHRLSRISLKPHAIPPPRGLQEITRPFAILVSGKNHRKTAGGSGSLGPLFFVSQAVKECSHSAHYFFADLLTFDLLTGCLAGLLLFLFISTRSFHAECNAPRSKSSSASLSRMCVLPIRPHPP
jgi:hypothetical protein